MKKTTIVVLVSIGIGLLLGYCINWLSHFRFHVTYSIRNSESVEDSKKNHAFLWEYEYPDTVWVNDSIFIRFKEAFAEYCRFYPGPTDVSEVSYKSAKVVLIIDEINDIGLRQFDKTWTCHDFSLKPYMSMVESLDSLPQDTMYYAIKCINPSKNGEDTTKLVKLVQKAKLRDNTTEEVICEEK